MTFCQPPNSKDFDESVLKTSPSHHSLKCKIFPGSPTSPSPAPKKSKPPNGKPNVKGSQTPLMPQLIDLSPSPSKITSTSQCFPVTWKSGPSPSATSIVDISSNSTQDKLLPFITCLDSDSDSEFNMVYDENDHHDTPLP